MSIYFVYTVWVASKESNRNNLLRNERRAQLLEMIREEGSIRVKDVSALFNVTEPTIRLDLEELERAGEIVREHGGAFLKSVPEQVREMSLLHTENIEKKQIIARKAADFVHDGDVIILDSGSTTTELAKQITDRRDLTVITNAMNVALILGSCPSIHVLVTGGEFKAPTLSLTGEKAAAFFPGLFVGKLFLAVGGISKNLELTYPGFNDLQVKQAMVRAAETTYALADSTKFNKVALASMGVMEYVDYLVSDESVPEDVRPKLRDLNVVLV